MLLTIPMFFLVGRADAAQKVCVALQGDGFSDNHTGAPITGNWADLAFAYDANNNITGGSGAIYLCDDDNNAVADNPPCSHPIIIDVLLTADTTGANPNSYWVTSDSYPGWGYTTTTTKATKTVPASSTTVIGGKSGIVARFSLDSDSDLVVAKLVDVSYIVGYANLCGQLWNTLGATSGNPVCIQNSDCQQFASGDTCTGGFCIDPPVIPAVITSACQIQPSAGAGGSCDFTQFPSYYGGATAMAGFWGNIQSGNDCCISGQPVFNCTPGFPCPNAPDNGCWGSASGGPGIIFACPSDGLIHIWDNATQSWQ